MSHTYAINLVHCVFSTKERAPTIAEENREKLWAYISGINKNIRVELAAIGGMSDHIHLLIALPSDKKLSEVVRDLKSNSSRWMRETTSDSPGRKVTARSASVPRKSLWSRNTFAIKRSITRSASSKMSLSQCWRNRASVTMVNMFSVSAAPCGAFSILNLPLPSAHALG